MRGSVSLLQPLRGACGHPEEKGERMFLSEGRNYGLTVPSWDSGTFEWNREPVS